MPSGTARVRWRRHLDPLEHRPRRQHPPTPRSRRHARPKGPSYARRRRPHAAAGAHPAARRVAHRARLPHTRTHDRASARSGPRHRHRPADHRHESPRPLDDHHPCSRHERRFRVTITRITMPEAGRIHRASRVGEVVRVLGGGRGAMVLVGPMRRWMCAAAGGVPFRDGALIPVVRVAGGPHGASSVVQAADETLALVSTSPDRRSWCSSRWCATEACRRQLSRCSRQP